MNDLNIKILDEHHSHFDIAFKIIIVGDSFVGKSCLALKGTKNQFIESYNSTIGFEFLTFNIKVKEKSIKLQIWDTCGQEVYRSLIGSFYKSSALVVLVFSINDHLTFESLDKWIEEIKNFSNVSLKIILVGNKSDLIERKVTKQEIDDFKIENNIEHYLETSALTGENCVELFVKIAEVLYNDYVIYKTNMNISTTSDITRNSKLENMKSKEVSNNLIKQNNRCCC